MPAINAETEVLLVAEDEELIHGSNYEMALMSCYPGRLVYVFGISASLRVFEKSSANFKSLGAKHSGDEFLVDLREHFPNASPLPIDSSIANEAKVRT